MFDNSIGQNGQKLEAESIPNLLNINEWYCLRESSSNKPRAVESCLLKVENNGQSPCTWCSLRNIGGLCVNNEQATMLNEFGIPHFNYEEVITDDNSSTMDNYNSKKNDNKKDVIILNDVKGCIISNTKEFCLNSPTGSGNGCTWCRVDIEAGVVLLIGAPGVDLLDIPLFGLCLSDEYYQELELEYKTKDATMNDIIHCSKTQPSSFGVGNSNDNNEIINYDVEGVSDLSCLIATAIGGNKFCEKSNDIHESVCVWENLFGLCEIYSIKTTAAKNYATTTVASA